MTLLILAGGMGSRFGGLKQMEPMGPNGEFIIDYSVYDAIKAGFDKIVFVIKEEIYEDFKNTIGKRIEGKVKVEYVFQKVDSIKTNIKLDRVKPLGTGHAILVAKDIIKEKFAVINADDFYGRDAFVTAYNYLNNLEDENSFGLVGYEAINTLTENGSVKRGILEIKDNKLQNIIESSIYEEENHIHCKSLIDNHEFNISKDTLVSMNMLLFTPKIFEYLEEDFNIFIDNMKDMQNDEFLIPNVLDKHMKNNDITVNIIKTTSKWYGVTYKEDKESVKSSIVDMINNKQYKESLWS